MPIEILMPALSPTMQEGSLTRWLKNEGDLVKSGDAIAEIETDKATMEVESADDGVLAKILVPAGSQGVKVNQTIALLLEEGEEQSALSVVPTPAPVAPSPQPKASPRGNGASTPAAPPAAREGERIFATPLARRLAKDAGINLAALTGSGPKGRIVKSDVEAAVSAPPARPQPRPADVSFPPPSPASAPPLPAEWGPAYTEVPLSSMRRVIAQRLSEAKRTVPHFYLTVDCVIDKLLALRGELNARSSDYKLSVNDFVIRASALALGKVPAANASFADTAIRLYSDVDISVAVATPAGLITPIIRHADHKGLAAIANETKALFARAREGKLKPQEFQGGGFSISNLGMMGVRQFEAIINPPQGCILAVGAGEQRPIVKDGALAVAMVMTCTLSVDHRVVDGAVGAEFLAAFKALIEDPMTMLL